jgi:hypothetical protein
VALPATVSDAILARVARLTPAAQDVGGGRGVWVQAPMPICSRASPRRRWTPSTNARTRAC